jgi:hypothetical protein
MELPHFLIAAGFIFLVGGFAGFALHKKNADQTADTHASQAGTTNPPSVTAAS